ncbi:peptidylprolyl isomerase [Prosthecomicrobium pneumaticum]|uniref:Parvulin-like PPIase n=1 Tax=Prosthecomicrobium pneumaticum TaxID=81895 RepID=A0A7W9CS80_9HYPH|nr:peptidylprolyl isomerase [Prosthecomicrobium pneumaticum]MBB5750965.1 peptidyl-prolyl cis-trans isomerase D [Prosthecomicrobium pneumaticum]
MLDSMRKYATSWVAYLFMGLLVISFGVWGIADIFRGIGVHSVAQVGGTEISAVSFDRAYRREIANLQRRLNQQVTPDQARMFGIPNQVLGRLITEAAFADAAQDMRIGVSDEMLLKEIGADPAFQGPSGGFDRATFVRLLQANDLNENLYVQERHALELRRQIVDALSGGAKAPETLLQALNTYRSEARTIRYMVVPASLVGTVADPNADELAAYFDEHKADWRAPEYRSVTLLKVDPADIAKPADVSEEDARARYEAQKARFTTPETRHVYQLLFADRPSAETARAKLNGGASFETVVAEAGKTLADTDLGVFKRSDMIDQAVADAAFALPENGSSEVVDGRLGPVIVHVGAIVPEAVKPFEAVAGEVRQEIATSRAAEEIGSMHDAIEDARAGGASLEEVAQSHQLTVRTIDAVDRQGLDEAGTAVADLPVKDQLLPAAFDSDVGIDNAALRTPGNGYVWFAVAGVEAARDRTLDEVRDKVVAAWKAQTARDRLTAKAKELQERLGKGETLDAVAASVSLPIQTAEGQQRSTTPAAPLSADALRAAFGGPKGYAAVAPGANEGEQIVLQVADVTEPAYFSGAPDLAQPSRELADGLQNDLLQQYVGELQNAVGVRVNQTALQQIVGAGS